MPGFFLTLIACLLALLPGRDGLRVAGLAARLRSGAGTAQGLLLAVWLSAAATSALAAWLATVIASQLPGPARLMLVAFALALAALELALRRAPPPPAEPTRSAGAMLLVLLAAQAGDGARLLVLALALVTAEPVSAALGGTLATGAALTLATLAGERWLAFPWRALCTLAVGLLAVGATLCALAARGLIG